MGRYRAGRPCYGAMERVVGQGKARVRNGSGSMRGEPKERPIVADRPGSLAFDSGHVSQHVRLLYVPPNVFGMQLAVSLWKHSFKSLLYLPSHYAKCPSPPLCTQTRARTTPGFPLATWETSGCGLLSRVATME